MYNGSGSRTDRYGSIPEEREVVLSKSKSTKYARGGGTIRKRSDGRWEARYTLGFDPKTGKQIQRSVYGATQKEVRQKLTRVLAEIDDGSYIEPCSMKMGEWLDIWLRDYTINIKPATHSAYEQHVRVHIKPELGETHLTEITPVMVQRLYNKLLNERKLSPKSVKNIHGVFHRAMEQAKRLGYLRVNPLDAVILPRVEKTQVSTLADDNLAKFLNAIKGDPYELVLFVTVFTGMRQGEVLGLTWDCVDFYNHTILVNKQHNRVKGDKEFRFSSLKNEKIRVITAASDVMDALRKQKQKQEEWAKAAGCIWNNRDNLVFTTQTGRYINNTRLYRKFKEIAKEIGLEKLRFHDLRHTYAVNSLRAGDDIKTVQENLGHATAAFTLSTYAHSTPGMKRESAARMEQFIKSIGVNA